MHLRSSDFAHIAEPTPEPADVISKNAKLNFEGLRA